MNFQETIDESIEVQQKSDYEIERNKPMPNKLHGILQSEITFQLRLTYNDQFDFPTEVSLNTQPGSTPDICIFKKSKQFIREEIQAKESEMPITTIEIISPSQPLDEMTRKVRKIYFPKGVKSAWIVVPTFKGIHLMLPGDKNSYFDSGILKDPTTGIEISIEDIFKRII